jgi:hypothetical protein
MAAAASNGLKAYELEQGNGSRVKEGDRVVVSSSKRWRGGVGWLVHDGEGCNAYSCMPQRLRISLPMLSDAQVHYDCLFRGIDAVSSRSARLLGGNRTIAEVGISVLASVPARSHARTHTHTHGTRMLACAHADVGMYC